MKIISLDSAEAVEKACSCLSIGGIVVYPTDTLYGFGVDGKNGRAIDALNSIKNRTGPMSVLTGDVDTALSWANVSENQKKLIASKLIGYTTIIFPVKNGIVNHKIIGNNKTLGVRKPKNMFCKNLAKAYPNPITSSSVNTHGNPPLNNPEEIVEEFGKKIDLIIDGGRLGNRGSSSIFKLENETLLQIR